MQSCMYMIGIVIYSGDLHSWWPNPLCTEQSLRHTSFEQEHFSKLQRFSFNSWKIATSFPKIGLPHKQTDGSTTEVESL